MRCLLSRPRVPGCQVSGYLLLQPAASRWSDSWRLSHFEGRAAEGTGHSESPVPFLLMWELCCIPQGKHSKIYKNVNNKNSHWKVKIDGNPSSDFLWFEMHTVAKASDLPLLMKDLEKFLSQSFSGMPTRVNPDFLPLLPRGMPQDHIRKSKWSINDETGQLASINKLLCSLHSKDASSVCSLCLEMKGGNPGQN